MIILLSPAKTLDFESPTTTAEFTIPDRLEQSESLIRTLRRQSLKSLMELMSISPDLAKLNRDRYQSWALPMTRENARQAILAFKGDVYLGLAADSLGLQDLRFAQEHLRILSGLHGMLRPLDLIQPYRLEMGTRLKTRRGKTLYDFWGNSITAALNEDLRQAEAREVVNLASNEYFSVLQPGDISARIVTPTFKEWKNGSFRFLSFFAKKARGLMARYAVEQRIGQADDLKSFDLDGYEFNPDLSSADDWVFTRASAG